MFTLHASGVGKSIAIGTARILPRTGKQIPEFSITAAQAKHEVARMKAAVVRAHSALQKIRDDLPSDSPEEVAALLSMHLSILQDPALLTPPSEIIRNERVNAEAALARHAAQLDKFFKGMDDPYLSGKSTDIAQVVARIQGELASPSDESVQANEISEFATGALTGQIIIANDISPVDAIELKRQRIAAFITRLGGPISHTAILARSLRIPAIVGMHDAIRYLRDGDLLVVDGKHGVVLVNPHAAAVATYERRREGALQRQKELDGLREAEAVTADGEAVSLYINIELPEEVSVRGALGAHGVGLYRTEFLFLGRAQMPDEEEQLEVYKRVLARAQRVVTIRTLDLGSDKGLPSGEENAPPANLTSALGRRALRLCLHDVAMFRPQLRALYRASKFGELRIMVPMISNLEELNQLFALLAQVKRELHEQGHAFNAETPIGAMIEVPAAAVAADLFARKLDFLSLGTNDLIQYTLAIDRSDDEVNYLYDPLHPAVLRLIQHTISAGQAAGIPVSMCGEMAGNPAYTRVLLGMGLREFSMEPASLLEVKRRIRMTDVGKVKPRVDAVLQAADAVQIKRMVDEINAD